MERLRDMVAERLALTALSNWRKVKPRPLGVAV